MLEIYRAIKRNYLLGKRYKMDPINQNGIELSDIESDKKPYRFDVINYLLQSMGGKSTKYLEIGVRNPEDNFHKINAKDKMSVDPGFETRENHADYKMTSDEFFLKLDNGEILSVDIRFDVIFIDGMHLAGQVQKDIDNALRYITKEGFIVLHDCNPPSEYHAREDFDFKLSPAGIYWNGTTWKAFYRQRLNSEVSCCCIDSDWGIGVISKKKYFRHLEKDINPFLEFRVFEAKRKDSLNLLDFSTFKKAIAGNVT